MTTPSSPTPEIPDASSGAPGRSPQLLIVCTGNTCRSPLAEAIARRELVRRGRDDVSVRSAGTSAWADAPASDGSLLVALEHGLDLSTHRARVLSPELVAASDLIVTMGAHHLDRVESMGGVGRAYLLTQYTHPTREAHAIADPFGGDLDVYRATYRELEQELRQALDRWLPTLPTRR
jgi:protein-tyrosine-phosphatase